MFINLKSLDGEFSRVNSRLISHYREKISLKYSKEIKEKMSEIEEISKVIKKGLNDGSLSEEEHQAKSNFVHSIRIDIDKLSEKEIKSTVVIFTDGSEFYVENKVEELDEILLINHGR